MLYSTLPCFEFLAAETIGTPGPEVNRLDVSQCFLGLAVLSQIVEVFH